MKEKLTQFSKGVFQYEKPSLLFSQEYIEFRIESGKEYSGSLTVTTEKKHRIKGIVCSTSHFLKIREMSFCGTDITIEYVFNASMLPAGDTHSGSIKVISNCGEYEIPFVGKVEQPYFESSIGEIKDLFQFTNLAKTSWIEALKMFRSAEFEEKLLSQDVSNQILYESLIKSVSGSHAMEEFLISIHKKVRTSIHANRTVFKYPEMTKKCTEKIHLEKDNWGYLEIRVSTDCDFIEPERKIIWAENFVDGEYMFHFTVDPEKMPKGRHEGKIYLKTPYQKLEFTVLVEEKPKETNKTLLLQKQNAALVQNYLNFRMNRIDSEKYMENMKKLLNGFYEADAMDEYFLLNAHLEIAGGKEEEVKETFGKLEERRNLWGEQGVYEAAFEYLHAMYKKDPDTIEEANVKIDNLYKKTDGDWRIFWFLVNVDKNFIENEELKFEALEALLEKDVYSPILYFEMAGILNRNPSYIKDLDGSHGRVLSWMLKEDDMCTELKNHYVYLASRKKSFHYIVYKNLVQIYEETESDEVLSAIISMLIKAQRSGKKYEKWYELGVEKQIRITQLYEFYMYSIEEDLTRIFPESVLQYFALDITLDENRKAFFYANLVQNKETYGKYFEPYENQIQEFSKNELLKKVINENLAVLYREYLRNGIYDEAEMEALPWIMFRHEITCPNPDMTGAVVIHGELKGETFVPLENGKAQLQIFTDSAQVFLVDRNQNRYAHTMEYSLSKFLLLDNLAQVCLPKALDNGMLLLYIYGQIENYRKYSSDAFLVQKHLYLLDELRESVRWNCYMKLVSYYFEELEMEELDRLLVEADFTWLKESDRSSLFSMLVTRKINKGLMEYIEDYGYLRVKTKKLRRFLQMYLQENGTKELPDVILRAAMHVIRRGKPDRELIEAVQSQYIGCLEDLYLIWEKAQEYHVEVPELEEQLISQTLFTECSRKNIVPVVLSYYQKEQKNLLVIHAFITYYSYRFVVREQLLQPELVELMQDYLRTCDNRLAALALLKEFSREEHLSGEKLNFAEIQLNRFVKEKLILPFFLDYRDKLPLPFELANKYYVTYVSNPESKVTIHYSMENGAGRQSEFKEDEMQNVFYGIFIKEFILFHNDRLQYYITEERDGESSITESIQITYQDDLSGEESEYNMLNSMLVANDMQDSQAVLDLLSQYLKTEYIISEKFKKLD